MQTMIKSTLTIIAIALATAVFFLMVPSFWAPWLLSTLASAQGVKDVELVGLRWDGLGLRADYLNFQQARGNQMIAFKVINPSLVLSVREVAPLSVHIGRLDVSSRRLESIVSKEPVGSSQDTALPVPPELTIHIDEIRYAQLEGNNPPVLRLNGLELMLCSSRNTFSATLPVSDTGDISVQGHLDLSPNHYLSRAEISLAWEQAPFLSVRAASVENSETQGKYDVSGEIALAPTGLIEAIRTDFARLVPELAAIPQSFDELSLAWQFNGELHDLFSTQSPWRMNLTHELSVQTVRSPQSYEVDGDIETTLTQTELTITALTPILVQSALGSDTESRTQVTITLNPGARLLLSQRDIEGQGLAGDIQLSHPSTEASATFTLDRLALDLSTLEGDLDLSLMGSSPILGSFTPDLKMQTTVGFADDVWSQGTFQSTALALQGNFKGQAILDGAAQWSVGLKTDELPTLLNSAKLMTDTAQGLELNLGGLQLHYSLRFIDDAVDQAIDLDLLDVAGAYDGYPFEGLNVQARLTPQAGWQSKGDIAVYVGRLDAVYPLFDVTAALTLLPDDASPEKTLQINHLSMNALDGKIQAKRPFRLALNSWHTDVELEVQDIRLAHLLAAYGEGIVDAVGIIDGNLPVSIRGGDVYINDGWAKNKDIGGYIRYQMEAADRLGDDHEEANLAFRMLEDFNYSDLGIKLTLSPAGDLIINLALDGHNPAVLDGQRVVFNVNVEQNIYEMIEAWRMTEKYLEAAGQRMRMNRTQSQDPHDDGDKVDGL